jgi:hypothetical protein
MKVERATEEAELFRGSDSAESQVQADCPELEEAMNFGLVDSPVELLDLLSPVAE